MSDHAPHLRLIQGGEPQPEHEAEAMAQLFPLPERERPPIPPELQQLTDKLHDHRHVELAKAVLVQYARYERLRRVATRLVEMETDPGGAA